MVINNNSISNDNQNIYLDNKIVLKKQLQFKSGTNSITIEDANGTSHFKKVFFINENGNEEDLLKIFDLVSNMKSGMGI